MAEQKQQTKLSREEIIAAFAREQVGYALEDDQLVFEQGQQFPGVGTVSVKHYLGHYTSQGPVIRFDPGNPLQMLRAYDLYRHLRESGVENVLVWRESNIRRISSMANSLKQVADLLEAQQVPRGSR